MTVSTKDAEHVVAKICGVKAGEDKFAAAEKVIAAMKLANFPKKDIAWAEKKLAKAKAANNR